MKWLTPLRKDCNHKTPLHDQPDRLQHARFGKIRPGTGNLRKRHRFHCCDFRAASHTFGIVLMQFSDWNTNIDARGSHCQFHGEHNHYKWQDFRRAFFTQDSYISSLTDVQTHEEELVMKIAWQVAIQ